MVIVRDINGNIISKEASQPYVSTRRLRNAHEQALCDKAMGIDRTAEREAAQERARARAQRRLLRTNMRRVDAGLEPIYDNAGARCGCEDYPCCGH
jgi:hypothetical protein